MDEPRKITKYLCVYKCGKKATNKKENMINHQLLCWSNPNNKSCKTCVHEIYTRTQDGYFRDCKNDDGNEYMDNEYESLVIRYNGHVKPVINCPYHKLSRKDKIKLILKEI